MNLHIRSVAAATTALFVCFGSALAADEPRSREREPGNDKEFIAKAISCEIAEVKLAEQMKKQTQNPEVDKFADTIIAEHSKIRDELIERAKSMKLAVVEGTEKEHRDEAQRFAKLSGAEGDYEYAKHVLESHNKQIQAYESWSKKSMDQQLTRLIENYLPVLREHKKHAEQLVLKLKK